VGDVGVPGPEDPCGCGRGLDRMEAIHGRDAEVIDTPSGNRLIVHFFTGLIEHFGEIDCFQAVQETPDTLVMRLVPVGVPSDDVAQRLVAKLKESGAADMNVEVEWVSEIPVPPSGKRRFVINRLRQPPQATEGVSGGGQRV